MAQHVEVIRLTFELDLELYESLVNEAERQALTLAEYLIQALHGAVIVDAGAANGAN